MFLDSRDTGDTTARCVETAGDGRYGIVPVFQGAAASDYVAFHSYNIQYKYSTTEQQGGNLLGRLR